MKKIILLGCLSLFSTILLANDSLVKLVNEGDIEAARLMVKGYSISAETLKKSISSALQKRDADMLELLVSIKGGPTTFNSKSGSSIVKDSEGVFLREAINLGDKDMVKILINNGGRGYLGYYQNRVSAQYKSLQFFIDQEIAKDNIFTCVVSLDKNQLAQVTFLKEILLQGLSDKKKYEVKELVANKLCQDIGLYRDMESRSWKIREIREKVNLYTDEDREENVSTSLIE